MNNQYLISVVIPVYNGEKFINRAMESLLNQTERNAQIILVNDGSTDGSGAVCDAFARQFDFIRVIHKRNGGLSSARNAGMVVAEGCYLMFVDVDDYLEPNTMERVAAVIRNEEPDCIDFGWQYVSESGEITPIHHKLDKGRLLGEEMIRDVILPPLLNLCSDPDHFIFDFSCTKVYRTDIIRENQIRFDENRRIWEDRPFVVQYLRYCKNYYSIDGSFYNYVDVPGSLSRQYRMEFFRIILENFRLYRDLYGGDYDFNTSYVNWYWSRAIESMIFRSLEQKENQQAIVGNIVDTLGDDQVKHWFAGRQPANGFERRVFSYIAAGQAQQALDCYRRRAAEKTMKEKFGGMIRRVGRKLLGRG